MIAALLDRVGEDTTAATADAAMPKRRRKEPATWRLPAGAPAAGPEAAARIEDTCLPGLPFRSDPVAKQPKPEPAIFDSAPRPEHAPSRQPHEVRHCAHWRS